MGNKTISILVSIVLIILGIALIYQGGFAQGGFFVPQEQTFYGSTDDGWGNLLEYNVNFTPESYSDNPTVSQGSTVSFDVTLTSINNDGWFTPIQYTWYYDGVLTATDYGGPDIFRDFTFNYAGIHTIRCDVYFQSYSSAMNWVSITCSAQTVTVTPTPTQTPISPTQAPTSTVAPTSTFTLTVQSNSLGGTYDIFDTSNTGTVYHNAGSYTFPAGRTVQIYGHAPLGYTLNGYYIDGTLYSMTSSVQIPMSGDHTIKAYYVAVSSPTNSPTNSPTATPTNNPTSTPSPTPTSTWTLATPTPSPSSNPNQTPTPTPSVTPSSTPHTTTLWDTSTTQPTSQPTGTTEIRASRADLVDVAMILLGVAFCVIGGVIAKKSFDQ